MKGPRAVLLEANAQFCDELQQRLRQRGFGITQAVDGSSVIRAVADLQPEVVLIGSLGPDPFEQVDVARQVRRRDRRIGIILLPVYSSEAVAIEALKAGVDDYLRPPFRCEQVMESIVRWLATSLRGKKKATVADDDMPIIGDSLQMQRIKRYIEKAASTDCNVLITGETGTGKELLAERIHRSSPRRDRPMVCINCAAIPEGLLESELYGYEKGAFTGANAASEGQFSLADGGTVFLDEIGDMNLSAQAKILRVLESKEIQRLGGRRFVPLDVRIIAATNQDVEHLVEAHQFRKDLFFRLNVARIKIPPLRERKDDIPALLSHYMQLCCRKFAHDIKGLDDDALACLLRYDWPGNVRELRNLIEAVFIELSSPRITLGDLPPPFNVPSDAPDLASTEKDRLLCALISTAWNKTKAAEKLNWSRMTVYRKMTKYQLREPLTQESARERTPLSTVQPCNTRPRDVT